MIVITTPAGQVGRQVLGNLLDSGEQLRVIALDPSRLPAGALKDLDIVEGSHGDAAVVDQAFAGADAVFWLTPPDRRARRSKPPTPASPGPPPRRSPGTASGASSESPCSAAARPRQAAARRATRNVPIPPELVALIRDHIEQFGTDEDGQLFRSANGNPIQPSTWWQVWRKVRHLTLTPEQVATPIMKRPYDLRHAGITWRLNSGVPPPTSPNGPVTASKCSPASTRAVWLAWMRCGSLG